MTTSNENLIKCIEADHAGGEGMKPLVIYHADCTDGYGSAFAAWLKFGDEAEYLPMQYGQVKTVAEMNSVLSTAGIPFGEGEVYILDFSLPKDVMAWLFKTQATANSTRLRPLAAARSFKAWAMAIDSGRHSVSIMRRSLRPARVSGGALLPGTYLPDRMPRAIGL